MVDSCWVLFKQAGFGDQYLFNRDNSCCTHAPFPLCISRAVLGTRAVFASYSLLLAVGKRGHFMPSSDAEKAHD